MVLIHYFEYFDIGGTPEQARRIIDQNRRNKEKAAWEAKNLKRKEQRELDNQCKLSIIHSIILYYFSNINFQYKAALAMPILTPSPSAIFEIGAYVRAVADTAPGMHPKHSEGVRGQVTQVDIEGERTRINRMGLVLIQHLVIYILYLLINRLYLLTPASPGANHTIHRSRLTY